MKAKLLSLLMLIMFCVGIHASEPASNPLSTSSSITFAVEGSASLTDKINIGEETYAAYKIGTSKAGGTIKVTVPAGATMLNFYALSWSTASSEVTITCGDDSKTITVTGAGISGNSPYTYKAETGGELTTHLYTYDFGSALAENTVVSLTSSVRVVFFGFNASNGGPEPIAITAANNGVEVANGKIAAAAAEGVSTTFTLNYEGAMYLGDNDVTFTYNGEKLGTPFLSIDNIFDTSKGVIKIIDTDADVDGQFIKSGTYTLTIASGALVDNDGIPNAEYSASWVVTVPEDPAYQSTLETTEGEGSYLTDKIIIAECEYPAYKIGTSKAGGSFSVTVPAGAIGMTFHALSWNTAKSDVTIICGDDTQTINVTGAGITGNSPYTYNVEQGGAPNAHFYQYDFDSALTEPAVITLSADARVVFFGLNAVEELKEPEPLSWSTIQNGCTYAIVNVQPESVGKSYYLYDDNGFLSVGDATDFNSATEWADAAKFVAMKTDDGKYTFRNVANGQYLAWRGANGGANDNKGFVDAVNNYSSWTMHEATVFPGTYWFVAKRANGNDGSLILSNAGAWNAWGNSEVTGRTDFSNDYGFVLLAEPESNITITWNVKDSEGNIVNTVTKELCEVGKEYTYDTFLNPFITGQTTVTATEESQTIDLSFDATKYYTLKMNRTPALSIFVDPADKTAIKTVSGVDMTYSNQDNFKWQFVGNFQTGFALKNKATDSYVTFGSENPDNKYKATLTDTPAEGAYFDILANGSYVALKIHGSTNNAYISNNGGVSTTFLTNWNSAANIGDGGAQIIIEEAEDIAPIYAEEAQIKEAEELVKNIGVGYPAADAEARVALENMLKDEQVLADVLETAVSSFKKSSEIEQPANEAAYALTFVAKDGNKWMLNNNDGTLNLIAAADEVPATAKWTAAVGEDGRVTFANGGKFLKYDSLGDEEGDDTKWSVKAMAASTSAQIVAGSDLFGLVYFEGKRPNGNTGQMIAKNDGTGFAGTNAPFYNDTYTSAIMLVQVAAEVVPVEVELDNVDVTDMTDIETAGFMLLMGNDAEGNHYDIAYKSHDELVILGTELFTAGDSKYKATSGTIKITENEDGSQSVDATVEFETIGTYHILALIPAPVPCPFELPTVAEVTPESITLVFDMAKAVEGVENPSLEGEVCITKDGVKYYHGFDEIEVVDGKVTATLNIADFRELESHRYLSLLAGDEIEISFDSMNFWDNDEDGDDDLLWKGDMEGTINATVAAIVPDEYLEPKFSEMATDGTIQYLYNVGTHTFVAGGNEYGTRASVFLDKGNQIKVTVNGDTYKLSDNVGNNGNWNAFDCDNALNSWVDGQGRSGDGKWQIIPIEGDEYTYKIYNTAAGNKTWGVDVELLNTRVVFGNGDADHCDVWAFVNANDFDAYMKNPHTAEWIEMTNDLIETRKKQALYEANKDALAEMKKIIDGTNIYGEGYDAYVEKYEDYMFDLNDGTLNEAVLNPAQPTGWHASTAYNFLLTPWQIDGEDCDKFAKALYINTWSAEGANDGSHFTVPFFEYWTNDNQSLGAKTISTVVKGLEPGVYYRASAWVRIRVKDGANVDDATGIKMMAGEEGHTVNVCIGDRVDGSPFRLINAQAVGMADEEGNFEVKFVVAADNNISWLSFKNVKVDQPDDIELQIKTSLADDCVVDVTETHSIHVDVRFLNMPEEEKMVIEGQFVAEDGSVIPYTAEGIAIKGADIDITGLANGKYKFWINMINVHPMVDEETGEDTYEMEFEALSGYEITIVGAPETVEDCHLTREMFHEWDSYGADGNIVGQGGCDYAFGTSTGMPYGNGSVLGAQYADLSAWSALALTVTEGTPRLLLNRQDMGGSSSDFLEINSADSPYVIGVKDGVWYINLAKIVEDKGYAHLNVIKGANWANVTITEAKLLADAPTAISNISISATKNGKFVKNGKIVIVKDGKMFNAAGARILK